MARKSDRRYKNKSRNVVVSTMRHDYAGYRNTKRQGFAKGKETTSETALVSKADRRAARRTSKEHTSGAPHEEHSS